MKTTRVAFSESPTRTIIGCRDCPVTMRNPWNMIHTVSTETATKPMIVAELDSSFHCMMSISVRRKSLIV